MNFFKILKIDVENKFAYPFLTECCSLLLHVAQPVLNGRNEDIKTLMIQLEVENDLVGIQGCRKKYRQGNVEIDVENEHIPLQGDEISRITETTLLE